VACENRIGIHLVVSAWDSKMMASLVKALVVAWEVTSPPSSQVVLAQEVEWVSQLAPLQSLKTAVRRLSLKRLKLMATEIKPPKSLKNSQIQELARQFKTNISKMGKLRVQVVEE